MALPNAAPLTFGHPFGPGYFPRYAGIRAKVSGTTVPAQIDKRALWADGSVRFGIISLKTPTGAGSTADIEILPYGAQRPPTTTALQRMQALVTAGYDAQVVFTGDFTATVSAQALLQTAISSGNLDIWLHGDVCTEVRVRSWLNGNFGVTMDIRAYDGGLAITEFLFHNDRLTWLDGTLNFPNNFTYSADIRINGSSAYVFASQIHHQMQWWRKRIWSGTEPNVRTIYNFDYWSTKARCIDPIDLDTDVTDSVSEWITTYQSREFGPLKAGNYPLYFPATGGGPHRGLIWQEMCVYLVSQNKAMLAILKGNAEAAGSVPWHYRDPDTEETVSVTKWPNLYIIGGYASTPPIGQGKIPDGVSIWSSGYTVDAAHRPNSTYLWYLLTGERSIYDDMLYDCLSSDFAPPLNRVGDKIILHADEARGSAWRLRNRLYVYYVTNEKKYQDYVNYQNLASWELFQLSYDAAVEGVAWGGAYRLNRTDREFNSWQEDFVIAVAAFGAWYGAPLNRLYVDWLTTLCVGRVASEHLGYSPYWAVRYSLKWPGQMINFRTGEVIIEPKTWAALAAENLTLYASMPTDLHAGFLPNDYGGHALGASISVWNISRNIGALRVVTYLIWRYYLTGSVVEGTGWTYKTPIMTNGVRIHLKNIVSPGTAGTLNGSAIEDQILVAQPGSTINAAGGTNILYVYSGTNTMNGSPDGDDVILGGKGVDIINPGPFDNRVQCGFEGSTRIDFGASNTGSDRIYNFLQSRGDRLNVLPTLSSAQATSLISAATTDASGDAVLTLTSGKVVTMVGHAPAALATSWFVIT